MKKKNNKNTTSVTLRKVEYKPDFSGSDHEQSGETRARVYNKNNVIWSLVSQKRKKSKEKRGKK